MKNLIRDIYLFFIDICKFIWGGITICFVFSYIFSGFGFLFWIITIPLLFENSLLENIIGWVVIIAIPISWFILWREENEREK